MQLLVHLYIIRNKSTRHDTANAYVTHFESRVWEVGEG